MSYSFFSQGEDGTINLQVRDASSNKSCDFNNNGIDVVLNRGEVNEITTTYKGLGIYKTVGDLIVEATTGDVYLNTDPSGTVVVNGGDLNMSSGDINNVASITSAVGSDMYIKGRGAGDIFFQTSNTTRMTVDNGGVVSFASLPQCSSIPTLNDELVNKSYVDTHSGGSQSLSQVLAVGNSAGTYNIDMSGNNIINTDVLNSRVNNDIYIDARGTGDLIIRSSATERLRVYDTGNIKASSTLDMSDNLITNCSQITATGDLILNPVGSIDCNGKNINLTGGEIHNCDLIHSQNNTDVVLEGKGTGDVIIKTNAINRITVADSGIATFSALPECSAVPSSNSQLVNKLYVDGLTPATPTLASVLTAGNNAGSSNIAMNGNSVNAVLNIQGSNNTDLNFIAVGTGDLVFKTNTNTTQFTISDTTGIGIFNNQISLARVMEKTSAGTVTTNAMSLDYTAINGVITCTPSSASNIALTLTNVPTTAGSYNLTFLIDTSTYKQYINSFSINGSSYTPVSSGGFSSLSVNASATSALQYVSIIMSGGTVSKVITNLVSLY